MTRAIHVNGQFDLSTWGVADTISIELSKECFKEINAALKEEFTNNPPRLSLPWMWAPESDGMRGQAVTDPVTIHIDLPLAASQDEEVTFAISLDALIDDYIEAQTNGNDPAVDKIMTKAEHTKFLSDRLRELADKLDAHCGTPAEREEFRLKYPAAYEKQT